MNEVNFKANDWLIEKFTKLKYRITFKTHRTQMGVELDDIKWVKRQIEDLEGGIVLKKSSLIKANLLWGHYSHDTRVIEIDSMELIDYLLEEGNKIGAIKEYRKIHKCSLREAKDFIDTRYMKLQVVV